MSKNQEHHSKGNKHPFCTIPLIQTTTAYCFQPIVRRETQGRQKTTSNESAGLADKFIKQILMSSAEKKKKSATLTEIKVKEKMKNILASNKRGKCIQTPID